MKLFTTYLNQMLVLSLSLITFGCSGSGGGSATPAPAASTTTVSGSVLAGPANNAAVTVKTTAGAIVAGPVSTKSDGSGSYSIDIPTSALSSDLVFEASGGTFDDEADQTTGGKGVPLGTLSAHISGGTLAGGSNVTIDPSSTIIRKMVAGGKSKTAAETAFAATFGYTPDCSVKPAFATMSTASTNAQRLAGLRIAAFSQLTKDLINDPSKQFEMIDALSDDISDDALDGKKSGAGVKTASGVSMPEDIGNRFVAALVAFQSSALNKSKLTPDKIGTLPFSKVATTSSYKVEYIPGATAATMGRTSFKIKLTNRSDNSAASGKAITLRPYMYMATKSHTTPMETPIDNGDGTYSCTVYYVMSSAVNGMSMGVWELKVTIGTESVTFYPVVGMPVGNDMLTKLLGVNDSIMGMSGLEKRTWFLFNDGLTAGTGGSYTFNIFLATKENGTALSFPAVKVGSTLNNQSNSAWTATSIAVEVSTDKTTWVTATDLGNGHWSAAGLTGLTAGTPGKIYVKLTVGDGTTTEQKTTDGSAVGAANGYQTFNVTPSGV